MHDCNSLYIISFYGAFISDPNICICMEYMDKGSLEGIYKQIGPIDIDVVGKVALGVLEGLTYLYDVHRIIHRGELPTTASLLYAPIGNKRLLSKRFADTRPLPLVCMGFDRYQALQYPLQFQRANQNL